MTFQVFIPARFGSSRLPGKPLADAGGKPLIQWVHEAACRSAAERVVIATDDKRVVAAARRFGAEVCLTGAHHASGTDRVCEAAELLGLAPETVIVNLQGDEPQMPGGLIDAVARTLTDSGAGIATAAHALIDGTEAGRPDVVKVVIDRNGNAMYFSRSSVPYPRNPQDDGALYRHLGLYAYRYDYLRLFTSRAPTVLERTEGLEQLRALEHGDRVAVHIAGSAPPGGIDTPEDLARFRRALDTSHRPAGVDA